MSLYLRLMFPLALPVVLAFSPLGVALEPCPQWSATKTIFNLPPKLFPEVSGMVASREILGRYYLVNDSGSEGVFFALDLPSGHLQAIKIQGFPGWDNEAITIGPCASKSSCIYVGDIGDNSNRRDFIRVAAVEEREVFPKQVQPIYHAKLTYPDGPKDAEAMVVTSHGMLLIFSKELGMFSPDPTRLYGIEEKELGRATKNVLTAFGKFSLSGLVSPLTVTDAALSADERSLFLLGYLRSYEIPFGELMTQAQNSRSHFTVDAWSFNLVSGYQYEAATYANQSDAIIWTYESKKQSSPLLQSNCLR